MTFDVDDIPIIDRSGLQAYAVCPAQARLCETAIRSVGMAAEIGNGAHDALSQTTTSYVDSQGVLNPREIVEQLEINLWSARPDVQPEVVAAVKASMWSWAKTLNEIHVLNILRWDGGEGDKSGQLAIDLETPVRLRVTSEIDLLHTTDSPKLLHEIDYKTGHAWHLESDVRNSFQFQLHAVLVFANYPEVDALDVTVWDTRVNHRTYRVRFLRDKLPEYTARIRNAVGYWDQYHDRDPHDCPTWPAREKCAMCDAAALCPVADQDIRSVSQEPAMFVREMVAVEERLKLMRKLAAAHVDKTGTDIVVDTEIGVAFGRNKPRSTRKVPMALYQLTSDDNEQERPHARDESSADAG